MLHQTTSLRAVPGPSCRWQQRVAILVALAMLVLRVAVWNCVELGAGKAIMCPEPRVLFHGHLEDNNERRSVHVPYSVGSGTGTPISRILLT